MSLPRLVVAAPSTGQGKTTIATGLMAALRSTGLEVSGHKVGPDYIDPGYHQLATARPGRNLDPHLVGEPLVAPLLLHGARGADVAVIEGVMGLYDGRLGTDGFASTAHVARLTRSPVVLVLDVARMSRTAAAVAAGLAAFEEGVDVVGVVLNRAGSERNDAEITRALAGAGLPVLGRLPRHEDLAAPSRHLGLVPAAERAESVAMVARLGEQVRAHLDLDALLEVARRAVDLDVRPWDPASVVHAPAGVGDGERDRPVVAVAGGRAFTFRYAETEELLRAAGCDVVAFDPVSDGQLPRGTRGIYLGGGFPEVHVEALAANRSLREDLQRAVAVGVPTVAECAGLLYLARTLDGSPMTGVLACDAEMTERLTLRYPVAVAPADSLLGRTGEEVTGHEFHRTTTSPASAGPGAWLVDGSPTGWADENLHASYLHVHWAGHPQLAQRFADAVHAAAAGPSEPSGIQPADPLLHHGDAEVGRGLLDLAVNVYPGPRPDWLDRALRESLATVDRYPDASPAAAALARHHDLPAGTVLPTAGAAEAFGLVARMRRWRHPVVVHPQFTEPHAALVRAGHTVTTVLCRPEDDFALEPALVPQGADLVVLGNPTNPTGVLHPAALVSALRREGRVVVIDEAFMDTVPGEGASLLAAGLPDVLVVRSLTKQWAIPGIRVGYVVGDPLLVEELSHQQVPWSLSTPAIAAALACATPEARAESLRRAGAVTPWRARLEQGLHARGIRTVPSQSSFVLARVGAGVHGALRRQGVAVRRCDTFPGLDADWVRIAVRPPATTQELLAALDRVPVLSAAP